MAFHGIEFVYGVIVKAEDFLMGVGKLEMDPNDHSVDREDLDEDINNTIYDLQGVGPNLKVYGIPHDMRRQFAIERPDISESIVLAIVGIPAFDVDLSRDGVRSPLKYDEAIELARQKYTSVMAESTLLNGDEKSLTIQETVRSAAISSPQLVLVMGTCGCCT